MVLLVYEPQYDIQGWFDDYATGLSWFDEELAGEPSEPGTLVATVIYEPTYVLPGWFDDQATNVAWFDEELGLVPVVGEAVAVVELSSAADMLDAVVVPGEEVHFGNAIGGPGGYLPEVVEGSIVEVALVFDAVDAVVVPAFGAFVPLPESLRPQSLALPAKVPAKAKDWHKYNEDLLLLID